MSSGTSRATEPGSRLRSVPDVLLEVENLHVSYASAGSALRGVSAAVGAGQVLAILGNNGAGKSTLLRAVSGTLRLQGGKVGGGAIRFEGRSLVGLDPGDIVRAGVVQVPEGRRIFQSLTVEENLRAGALSVSGRANRARARARVFDLFPVLEHRRHQHAGLLSGGEQQMLAIGRALMSGPRLLMLDEPSLGLAPKLVDQIADLIVAINQQGTSVVLVEQNAAMALGVADRALVLEVGLVTLEGTASQLAGDEGVRDRYLGVGSTRPERVPGERVSHGGRARSQPLSVDRVSMRFGGVDALSEVSFTVEPGTTHAVIGPNGAGKSTCLNVLTGVYCAQSGAVRYGEHELTGLRPHRIAQLGISRTFQNLSLSGGSTVAENLLLGRHRMTRAGFVATGFALPSARRERLRQQEHVRRVAGLVGLGDLLERRVEDLPYGTRKRVEFARALCAEPELLLLDEPVAGMNAEESKRMAQVIISVREEFDVSILLIEHDMAFVMGLADWVTVLDFGKRIAGGPPSEVQRDPNVVRAYLGVREGPA